jgi:hypothetical protein
VTAEGGYETSVSIYLTGLDVDAKFALLCDHVERVTAPLDLTRLRIDRMGTPAEDPLDQWAAAQQVLITAQARDRSQVDLAAFVQPLVGLFLEGFPGFYVIPVRRTQRVEAYWPAVVPIVAIEHAVVLPDGQRTVIPHPTVTEPFTGQPAQSEPPLAPRAERRLVRVPLGRVAHARSGDKGPNSNIGFWTYPHAWPWLRSTLTTDALYALFPAASGLRIERHELPGLRVVHFVVHGALEEGAASNGRPDIAGKAIAEFLRARHIDVPAELVPVEFLPDERNATGTAR